MSNYRIKVKSRTWERDSYGLFDYETTDITKQQLTIDGPGNITRTQNKVSFLPEFAIEETGSEVLLSVFGNDGDFYLDQTGRRDLWYVLSSKVSDDKCSMPLKENNVFKMGRIPFRVVQIKNLEESNNFASYYKSIITSIKTNQDLKNPFEKKVIQLDSTKNSFLANQNLSETEADENNKKCCRICLSEAVLPDDPLLSPCLCNGSMKYVHLKCLQTWFKNKLDLKSPTHIISILWSDLCCELCKTFYPITFFYKEKAYDIIDFSEANNKDAKGMTKTIVLESQTKERQPNGVHFINFSQKDTICLGRGNDCDIKLKDISVSRVHSKIKLTNNRFYLVDNGSKFGTLVQLDEPLKIETTSCHVQVGRTAIELFTIRSWNSYFSCLSCGSASTTHRTTINASNSRNNTDIDEKSKKGKLTN